MIHTAKTAAPSAPRIAGISVRRRIPARTRALRNCRIAVISFPLLGWISAGLRDYIGAPEHDDPLQRGTGPDEGPTASGIEEVDRSGPENEAVVSPLFLVDGQCLCVGLAGKFGRERPGEMNPV